MKKVLAIVITVTLVFSAAGPVYADGPVKKLGRGIANTVTCPLELFAGIRSANDENGAMAALTWGILSGTLNILKRAAVGVYEVVTFPIPLPADYAPILDDPEFFFASETNVLGD